MVRTTDSIFVVGILVACLGALTIWSMIADVRGWSSMRTRNETRRDRLNNILGVLGVCCFLGVVFLFGYAFGVSLSR